ncbi:hypothetical protein ACFLQZ_00850 [Acidobacteriota bacterium]
MLLFKKHEMPFEGKNYEIRVYYDDRIINVVTFLNNYPASGFRHQIKIPPKRNAKDLLDKAPVQELVEIAKNDVTSKRWQRLIQ